MRKGTLLHKMQMLSSLRSAWQRLNKANPQSYGPSGQTLKDFAANLNSNLPHIRKRLNTGRYAFAGVRGVVISETRSDGTKKRRPIRVADIRDRVVQRAIADQIEPILSKQYSLRNDASFAYQRKRSIRDAQLRMVALYKAGNHIVFEADLQSFFDTVDREKLLEKYIFPALTDDTLNALIVQALNQEVQNRDSLEEDDNSLFVNSGIPQGGAISPLFANVYLNKFDQHFLSKGLGLVRYADDFIVMCRSYDQAKEAYHSAKDILERELGLRLHEFKPDGTGKTKILRVTQDKFTFLGVGFNGSRLWPSEERLQKLSAKINVITEFNQSKRLMEVLQDLKWILEGWLSAYCHTDVAPYLSEISAQVRGRVGHCAYKMKWMNHRTPLTDDQWGFSGLPDLKQFLEKQRERLKHEKKYQPFELFYLPKVTKQSDGLSVPSDVNRRSAGLASVI